jgi:hypothetical protein
VSVWDNKVLSQAMGPTECNLRSPTSSPGMVSPHAMHSMPHGSQNQNAHVNAAFRPIRAMKKLDITGPKLGLSLTPGGVSD